MLLDREPANSIGKSARLRITPKPFCRTVHDVPVPIMLHNGKPVLKENSFLA